MGRGGNPHHPAEVAVPSPGLKSGQAVSREGVRRTMTGLLDAGDARRRLAFHFVAILIDGNKRDIQHLAMSIFYVM
jgi:hypothetical protein